jgi:hypothetical protein
MGRSRGLARGFAVALAFCAAGCAGRSESNDTRGSAAGDGGTGGTGASGGTGTSGEGGTGATGATGGLTSKGGAGGSTGSGASGGMIPVAGAGGGAGVASAGTDASGGVGATGATAGAGATGGTSSGGTSSGGESGGGGAGGVSGGTFVRECETADDCMMMDDCCGCRAASKTTPGSSCLLPCLGGNACEEAGIGLDELECVAGRCVIDRSCNVSQALCSGPLPTCPDGLVPSLINNCYGACLPPTQCRDVFDCSDCGDAHCVESQAWLTTITCVPRVSGCGPGNLCSCLEPCPIGGCQEEPEQLTCVCITC